MVERRARGTSTVRDESGNKQCVSCLLWLDPIKFRPHKKTLDRLTGQCSRCLTRWEKYKLRPADISAMLQSQNGCCALCCVELGDAINIDHDHECCPGKKTCGRCIRGILCSNCNVGLGKLRDSAELLRRAAKYIESKGKISGYQD